MSKQKTCLILGNCGFVGRHMTKRLCDLGYKVTGIDSLMSESSLYPGLSGDPNYGSKWPQHLKCDFNFYIQDAKQFFEHNTDADRWHFDLVVHLAAVVGGRVTIENAPLAVAEDLAIDAMMFNWATKTRPKKILYFSSSAAYPIKFQQNDELVQNLSEDMIDFTRDIGVADMSYGWSKLTGEFLARLAHEKYDLDVVCYRPFSGYGEDQHPSYPFPAILRRAIAKEEPLTVWSDTVRDFIYIEDCIDGVFQTMDKVSNGSGINLGTGIATNFASLASQMAEVVSYTPEIKVFDDKPKGVIYRVADTTYAESLDFKAKTTLIEGIRKATSFIREDNLWNK